MTTTTTAEQVDADRPPGDPDPSRLARMSDRIRGTAPPPSSGVSLGAAPVVGDGGGGQTSDADQAFQRKSWDDLSDGYRRQLELRGQTRERHEAGKPPPRAKDSAPKRGKGHKRPTEPAPDPGPKRPTIDALRGELQATVGRLGLAISLVDRFDGAVLLANAEGVAAAAADLAESNPSVRRTLERLTEVSGYAQLATVGAQVALPILMHHRIIPASPQALKFLGVPQQALDADPDLLKAPPPPEDRPLDPDVTPTGSTVADGKIDGADLDETPYYDPGRVTDEPPPPFAWPADMDGDS